MTTLSFWSKVGPGALWECWEWQGPRVYGYGTVKYQGKTHRAHRLAWELAFGPIPRSLVMMHLCNNPACVNPNHLRPGTQQENLAYASELGRLKQSAETGLKKSLALTGQSRTAETRRRMSLAQMGNKSRAGKLHTEETKQKISAAQKGIPRPSRSVKGVHIGHHNRWHRNRGISSPNCSFCGVAE